ncbi:sulfotransferase [Cognatishimia sp. MH4019]|uniref:sulfotransferase family protein n=1 Tax=Cognatishimia sp. MH4019 TaxID=2854030 RepID=UPI001CD1D7BB|nr:sulfotransferase [Cognatishimia sp. MH4019]
MKPNLFLIAAPRAGSTQLSQWLASHADIGLPKIKEPNHFSAHEFDPDYVARSHLNDVDPARFIARGQPIAMQFAVFREPAHYAALFAPLTQRYRLDASTSYLACPQAPALIRTACPDAKLIILTRDPLQRALSHYHLARRTGRTRASLASELRAEQEETLPLAGRYLLRPSRQAEAVARYQQTFHENRICLLRFEDMIAAPQKALTHIARWLDIDPTGFDLTQTARNASAAPRLPALNAALHRCGLKTALRAALPRSVKHHLKPLWFGASLPKVPASEVAALREALQ